MRDNNAVTGLMGVMLMVAVVVSVSATLFVSVNKITITNDNSDPIIIMVQNNEKIQAIVVQNGPVYRSDLIIDVFDRQGSQVSATITFYPPGSILNVGDYFKISGLTTGETYTISLVYENTILTEIEYFV